MQTFTLAQLADPQTAEADKILRACVHCGFCTATCPTYVLLGDELDSPRGRIYLIKEMLENDRPATAEVVKHIDRCLSCLACMTTCPSGVHYMHLVDHARDHIEQTYKRPLGDRLMRGMLARVLPNPALFRWAAVAGLLAQTVRAGAEGAWAQRLAAMLRLTPSRLAGAAADAQPQDLSRRGRTARPGGAACRLHQSGAGAFDQRGGHPRAQPPRHRGGDRGGRGLLRLARAPHGSRGRRRWRRRATLIDAWTARDRGRRARRHPDHRLRLRHDA